MTAKRKTRRRESASDRPDTVVDSTDHKRAELALLASEQRLRAVLDTIADAILIVDRRGVIQSVSAAAERMFGYAAAEMLGQNLTMTMSPPNREPGDGWIEQFRKAADGRAAGRETDGRRKNGSVFPAEWAVTEIKRQKLFIVACRDLTECRRLEREVVEAAAQEQRRIGQDLHDTIAQELTALNLLAYDLAGAIRADSANARLLAEQIGRGFQRSQQQLRAVLRGLVPVAVDADGLAAALADLTQQTKERGTACTFDCPAPVTVADNQTATHLYLIALEAVRNALQHARARAIRISLTADGVLALCIRDDGVGVAAPSPSAPGLGLRIMRNRAAIIGATLSVAPAEPAGTVVTCLLPGETHEPNKEKKTSPRGDHR